MHLLNASDVWTWPVPAHSPSILKYYIRRFAILPLCLVDFPLHGSEEVNSSDVRACKDFGNRTSTSERERESSVRFIVNRSTSSGGTSISTTSVLRMKLSD